MVYLIGSLIKYRSDDGVMWLAADESSAITLTVTMNRMLSFIISRRGQVVPRDEILDSVWDAHGLTSSNNTLNKYISEIRKKFVKFGLVGECITTVPKIGFIFNTEVDVQVLPDDDNVESYGNRFQAPTYMSETSNQKGCRQFYVPLLFILSLAIIAISFSIHNGALITAKKNTEKKLVTHFLFNYESCPVYTTQENSPSLSHLKKEIFMRIVTKDNVSCLPGSSFFYQASESYIYGEKGRVFLNRCTTKDNRFVSCLNYYWSGYEQDK